MVGPLFFFVSFKYFVVGDLCLWGKFQPLCWVDQQVLLTVADAPVQSNPRDIRRSIVSNVSSPAQVFIIADIAA